MVISRWLPAKNKSMPGSPTFATETIYQANTCVRPSP